MPRTPRTAPTSRIGVALVDQTCARAHQVWRETPHTDIGIDGQIEFMDDDGQATGAVVGVQIRTGASYVSDNGATYCVNADREHLSYWAALAIPVIGVVVDPETNGARWVDLTRYCSDDRIANGPYTIPLRSQSDREFTVDAVSNQLRDLASSYARAARESWREPLRCPPDGNRIASQNLLPPHRLAWNQLAESFASSSDLSVIANAGYRLSWYFLVVPQSFRDHVMRRLSTLDDPQLAQIVAAGASVLEYEKPAESIADLLRYVPHASARVASMLLLGLAEPRPSDNTRRYALQLVEMWNGREFPALWDLLAQYSTVKAACPTP